MRVRTPSGAAAGGAGLWVFPDGGGGFPLRAGEDGTVTLLAAQGDRIEVLARPTPAPLPPPAGTRVALPTERDTTLDLTWR